jgi:hypothetical protein
MNSILKFPLRVVRLIAAFLLVTVGAFPTFVLMVISGLLLTAVMAIFQCFAYLITGKFRNMRQYDKIIVKIEDLTFYIITILPGKILKND